MSIQRIEDKRRICVPDDNANVCSKNPYFQAPAPSAGWTSNVSDFIYDGYVKFRENPDYVMSSFITTNGNKKIGFIVTVDIEIGQIIDIWGTGVQFEPISMAGRYTGILNNPNGQGCGAQQHVASTKNDGKITELFFFDADKYSYTDFLVDPVADLAVDKGPCSLQPVAPLFGVATENPALQWAKLNLQTLVGSTANVDIQPNINGVKSTLVAINTADQVELDSRGLGTSIVARTYKWRMKIRTNFNEESYLDNGNIDVQNAIKLGFQLDNGYSSDTGELKIIHGPGDVIATGNVARSYLIHLSKDEWTEVEYTTHFTAIGTVNLLIGMAPQGQPYWKEGEHFFEINDVVVIDDLGREHLNFSGAPNYPLGARVENAAWTGLFADPVAWVCSLAGSPGLWDAIFMYDALNSSKDPYGYDYVGGAWKVYEAAAGPGVADVAPNDIYAISNAQGYIGIGEVLVPCIVPYELVTVDYHAVASGSGPWCVRMGGVTANDISFGAVGTYDGPTDKTIGATPSDQSVVLYAQNPNGVIHTSKLLVHPKYPFLTKAPSSFTATVVDKVYSSLIPPDVWCGDGSYKPTYSAGTQVMGQYQGMFQQIYPAPVAGKTYRLRVNVTAIAGTPNFQLYVADFSGANVGTFAIGAGTGMKEITFVCPAKGVKFNITNQGAAGSSVTVDYARFYAE